MKIFTWNQDVKAEHENPFQAAWQAVAQDFTSIFTNRKEDQFATRVSLSGRIDDKKFGTWRAPVRCRPIVTSEVAPDTFRARHPGYIMHSRTTP